jgi:hypothetical protein
MRIKKVSEELKYEDIISVLDVEDYLQEVWDKYNSVITNYKIERSFIRTELGEGKFDLNSTDEEIHKGDTEVRDGSSRNTVLRQEIIDYKGNNIGFEIAITLKPDNNIFWDEFIKVNFQIEFLSDITSGLKRINPIALYATQRGNDINISVVTNIIL